MNARRVQRYENSISRGLKRFDKPKWYCHHTNYNDHRTIHCEGKPLGAPKQPTQTETTMTATTARTGAANLKFSHMGLSVKNLEAMEEFYTKVLGFTVTDRGLAGGMQLVFLSRDPQDHHQIVLATGRPAQLPPNTANPQFGPSINQISFKVASLPDLRDILERLNAGGGDSVFPANHGVAWSIYAHDPEGNNLEFFVDTDWYIKQPFLIPLDFSKTDEEIYELTKSMCESSEGFQPYSEWRDQIAPKMNPYVEAAQ